MTMPQQLWVFRAYATRVIDGDTVDAVIDAGYHATRTERLRFLGVNAPERKVPTRAAGDKAKAFVEDWLMVTGGELWSLIIQTEKSDVFGRYLCLLWRTVDQRCLNDDLLSSGNAVPFMT